MGTGSNGPEVGPDTDIEALDEISRAAAGKWPGLAPMGGDRWSREDIDLGISVAFCITTTPAFRRAFPGGLEGGRSRRYVLRALFHDLVRNRVRTARLALIDSRELDALPSHRCQPPRVHKVDMDGLMARVKGRLPERAVKALVARLRELDAGGESNRGSGGPSRRTRKRTWALVRKAFPAMEREFGLDWEEMREVLIGLDLEDGS